MSSNFKQLFLVLFTIGIVFTSCNRLKETDGPYFGNGFHNGWADQNSIVIWTRLTQIPEGLTLNDMIGACPGAAGEVKLSYFPLKNAENKTETKWIAVDNNKNFTIQWKLENLSPDTKYVVEVEARLNESSAVSDKIEGAFRTPPPIEKEEEIEFCVVTCHDYIRKDTTYGHKIYSAMLNLFPDFYVHTGDVEYYDNYANEGFQTEGDEIRAFLNQFENVYLCNGDRHWQYVTHPEETNLWEFSTGAGSDVHAGGWSQSDKRLEHRLSFSESKRRFFKRARFARQWNTHTSFSTF